MTACLIYDSQEFFPSPRAIQTGMSNYINPPYTAEVKDRQEDYMGNQSG